MRFCRIISSKFVSGRGLTKRAVCDIFPLGVIDLKKDRRREYFSIPNIMSYFRLLLIPVYLYFYFAADEDGGYGYAAAVIAVSGLTDMLDGKIARRYNMITEWGKFIDPVADKLTLAAIALSMSFRYPLMGVMFGVYVVKELYMFFMGAYMMKRGFKMDGAQWYGKMCTAVTYSSVFLLLVMPHMPEKASTALISLCLLVTLAAFAGYALFYMKAKRGLTK